MKIRIHFSIRERGGRRHNWNSNLYFEPAFTLGCHKISLTLKEGVLTVRILDSEGKLTGIAGLESIDAYTIVHTWKGRVYLFYN